VTDCAGEELKVQAAVEKFSLISVTKDFMHLDPASRYQIAKNAFNRALFDARVRDLYLHICRDPRPTRRPL
jgi:hypothetical protein